MAVSSTTEQSLPPTTEERLTDFIELIATAIANAESRAELTASRARIVAAGDEARRRIERDLHDGTQQRLVSLALAARAAAAELPTENGALRERFSSIAAGLGAAVEELQELSRGIHPSILFDAGLGPALESLAFAIANPRDAGSRDEGAVQRGTTEREIAAGAAFGTVGALSGALGAANTYRLRAQRRVLP